MSGLTRAPVMIKRAPRAALEEWLLAAEYVLKGGNDSVFLCERGDISMRRTEPALNLGMILHAMDAVPLPVIADPSHGTGIRRHVAPMARAAAVAGAHGIMVEVNDDPEAAFVDGKQSLSVPEFGELMREIRTLRQDEKPR